ncbi:MAG: glutamyl-tRNA reductase [Bacteroidetes bacterium]|nr:glutamyl-tRNA reductase [Bacteroidota bacterium]
MESLHAIALTHQNIGVDQLGEFHISEEFQQSRLTPLKAIGIDEVIFLTTCNRVELLIRSNKPLDRDFLTKVFQCVYPKLGYEKLDLAVNNATTYSNLEAVFHWFRVASSLDSLVIGEREILGQMRDAYNLCKSFKLNGDFMRILMKKTIETGKLIYTETEISNSPVSVVNLAYKKLESLANLKDSKILVIGAGKTNTALIRKMKKHGASDFTIFNRTLSKAEKLAENCGGKAYDLNTLGTKKIDFNVLITCTGSEHHILDHAMYENIKPNTNESTVIVDLAIPNDVSEKVRTSYPVQYISVDGLRELAAKNMEKRRAHLSHCEEIIAAQVHTFRELDKIRQVEIAMRTVPEQVKEIKRKALEEVFAKDLEGMDVTSKQVLDKVVQYMEKKYMSTPMLMAKEILLKENIR